MRESDRGGERKERERKIDGERMKERGRERGRGKERQSERKIVKERE